MHLYNVYQPTIIYYACIVINYMSITLYILVKTIINYRHGVPSQGHYRYFSRIRVHNDRIIIEIELKISSPARQFIGLRLLARRRNAYTLYMAARKL